jgi:hypothetical protein
MKKILAALFVTMFLCTSAQAFTVFFDQTGSGLDVNLVETQIMQLNSMNNPIVLPADAVHLLGETNPDQNGHIFTYQNKTTGDFTEKFTVRVTEGIDSNTNYITYTNIFLDIDLIGKYIDDDNIYFTGGSARMYKTGVIEDIASFSLGSALISDLAGTLLTDLLAMKIDFEFIFDDINEDFWGPNEEYLVGKSWLLAMVGGRIDQLNIWDAPTDNEYIIEWRFPGAQVRFSAVPEPATMLLFGLGLIGLAGASRRKLS